MAASNEPAEAALRVEHARERSRRRWWASWRRRGCRPRSVRWSPRREAVIVDGGFDAHASPLHARGAFMPQSRALGDGRARGRAPAGRARARPVRGAGRQGDAPGRADGGQAARSSRSSAIPAARERSTQTCRRMRAGNVSRPRRRTRSTPSRTTRPSTACCVDPPCTGLGTLRSRPDLRWRVSAGDVEPARGDSRRELLAAGGGGDATGRHARLLDVHDLAGRERAPDRALAVPSTLRSQPTTCAPRAALAPSWRALPPADAAASRRHRRLLHRQAASDR